MVFSLSFFLFLDCWNAFVMNSGPAQLVSLYNFVGLNLNIYRYIIRS